MPKSEDQAMSGLELEPTSMIGQAGDYAIYQLNTPIPIKAEWEALQQQFTGHIYQNYDWVRIACDTLEADENICIIAGKNDAGLQFVLPMVIEGKFFKTLRWVGGSHANICSGLYSEAFLKSDNKNVMMQVIKLITNIAGQFTILKLGNQPYELNGLPNPMASLKPQNSVNIMYDMNLSDGMDAILDAGNGKRKRKLWRKQNRVVEKMGGYELICPETHEDILEALEEFHILKAKRFKEMGVHNVFEEKKTQEFFKRTALQPAKNGIQIFKIFQLKVADKTRAMYAFGVNGTYCQAYVNAVEYDEFSSQSPGEMIMYAMVERLVEEKYKKLDIGVGDERYKRSWCPNHYNLFDTILPLSLFTKPIVVAIRLKNRIKRYIRNHPQLWAQLKKLRKTKADLLSKNQS